MNPDNSEDLKLLINIFGKRGSGKTTLIRENLNSFPGPVAVVDILGNFDIKDENEQSETYGEPIYPVTGQTSEFIEWLEEWHKNPDEQNKVFVLMPGNPDVALDYVSASLWELKGGTLVLDEADGFSIANAPCFDSLVRYGRNRGIHLITGCRRPAELSRNITAGANRILVLRTQEPRDIEYFEKTLLGDRASSLASIPEFNGLLLDYDKNQISQFEFNQEGEISIKETSPF